jgi:hypothetical protein
MMRNASFHCGGKSQGLVDADKVVMHVMERRSQDSELENSI